TSIGVICPPRVAACLKRARAEKHRRKRLERLARRNSQTMQTFQTFFRGLCTGELFAACPCPARTRSRRAATRGPVAADSDQANAHSAASFWYGVVPR